MKPNFYAKLFFLFVFLFAAKANAQNVTIPDANFKAYLLNNKSINTLDDGEISVAEAQAFTGTVDCSSRNIANLTGIEAFTKIKTLYCYSNKLTALDVSKNTVLEVLYCDRNLQIASLDVSKNTALKYLVCGQNNLTSLDISKNTLLTNFSCNDNKLTTIDISKNTALQYLYCENNLFTNLDVSKHTALLWLSCQGNKLTSLNLKNGQNSKLATFNATGNANLTCIQVDNVANANTYTTANKWKKDATASYNTDCNIVYIPDVNFKNYLLSVSAINTDGDTEIQVAEAETFTGTIDCGSKNIADLTGIEAFTKITALYCYTNQLTALDVSKNTLLNTLSCASNQITTLDVSKNTVLKNLYCQQNLLVNLDVNQNTALADLRCYQNQLTTLDVSKNTALTILYCLNNQLTSLNLKNGQNSKITSFDVTNNPNLTCIQVDNVANANTYTTANKWTKDATASYNTDCNIVYIPDVNFKNYLLSVSAINTNGDNEIQVAEAEAFTGTIDCQNKNIASLTGIEAFTKITKLYCNGNQLTSINVSQNTLLQDFRCQDNQISVLDVTKNTALTRLQCSNNLLDELDISKNTLLRIFSCSGNKLTVLDVSQNTALTDLICSSNKLTALDVSQNLALTKFYCDANQITALDLHQNTALADMRLQNNKLASLNLKNGTNTIITAFNAKANTTLSCIQVDNPAYSETASGWQKDAAANYNTDCSNIPNADNILYVNQAVSGGTGTGNSWANAIPQLADALKYARGQNNYTSANPLKIYVAKGTYKPLYNTADGSYTTDGTRDNAFVMVNNVQIYGGFDLENNIDDLSDKRNYTNTILSGDIGTANDNTDNCFHVVVSSGAVGVALLDGFTVTGSYSTVSDNATITVNGNTINKYNGGGMYNSSSSPTITNCTFTGNTAYRGGGMYNTSSSPTVTNCTFTGNTADLGGGIYNISSSPTVINCLFAGNTAVSGGGIHNSSGNGTFINVTMANNGSKGFYAYGWTFWKNSIIWDTIDGSNYNADYSLLKGLNPSGTGNVNATSLAATDIFTNYSGGDYTLKNGGAAVNVGSNALFTGLDANTKDLAGNPRVYDFANGGIIDLGAYEYQGDPVVLPLTLISFTAKADGNHAKLQWQTTNEVNNKGVEIWRGGERQEGGGLEDVAFVKIGDVSAPVTHNTQPVTQYNFTDKAPLKGTNYYKLVQVDNDGKSTELGVRTATFNFQPSTFNLYPNPTNNKTNVAFEAGKYQHLTIADVNGKILQRMAIKPTEQEISVSLGHYPTGVYLIKLIGKETKVYKAIKTL